MTQTANPWTDRYLQPVNGGIEHSSSDMYADSFAGFVARPETHEILEASEAVKLTATETRSAEIALAAEGIERPH